MTVQKRKYAATMAQSIGEMAMLPRRYAVSRRPVKRSASRRGRVGSWARCGAAGRERPLPQLPGEGERERAAMADHAVRGVRAHVEERAGLEVACLPSAPDPPFVEILARAGHRRTRRHGAPALELHPDGFDGAVVMQAQALTPLAVDDEEERALLAPGAEAAIAQSRHEPRHA